MKNYFYILIIIILFGACGKNNKGDNLIQNNTIPLEINNLNDSNTSGENIFEQTFFPTHWTVDNLRLREEHDTGANILQTLQKGTAVQKLDSGRIQNIDGITAPWLFVQTEDGEKGWCFGGYLADKHSLLMGIWVIWQEAENGTGWRFYYFTANKAVIGIFSSGFFGVYDWSVADNSIHIDGEASNHGEREAVSLDIPFTVIDYDTIKIDGTTFVRFSEQDLPLKYSSIDILDDLIERF